MRISDVGKVTFLVLLSLQAYALHVSATRLLGPAALALSSRPVLTQAPPDGQQTSLNIQSRPVPTRSKHGNTLSVHDVAIAEVTIPQTATVGDTVAVNSTVVNYGTETEHPIVQLIVNGTLTRQDSVMTIGSHSTIISTIYWNTTGNPSGTYSLVVKVLPVQEEHILTNNILPPVFMTLNPPPSSTPSSRIEPARVFSREILLAIAILETVVLSLFVVGRGLTARSFFSRHRRPMTAVPYESRKHMIGRGKFAEGFL